MNYHLFTQFAGWHQYVHRRIEDPPGYRPALCQESQESQNTNLNVTDDADNHSSPQLNDQMMNLVQSLTSSVTSLQQQVSEMAKKKNWIRGPMLTCRK